MEVKIRHAKPADYRDLCEVYSQPEVVAGTLQIPLPPEDLWKNRLAETPKNSYVLVSEVEGRVLGNLGLFVSTNSPRRQHSAYIGMAVHDEWHGKGLGKAMLEAALDLSDNWLNLSRLELTVFVNNQRAVGLYEKFGFVREGVLTKYAFTNGEYQDVYSMARIR